MISALAKAGAVLNEPSYVERAVKASHFIRQHLFDAQKKRLIRSCYRGVDHPPVQKYANFTSALVHSSWSVYRDSAYFFVVNRLFSIYFHLQKSSIHELKRRMINAHFDLNLRLF